MPSTFLARRSKKRLSPTHRRELAAWFPATNGVGVVRAYVSAQFGRAGWYNRSTARDQTPPQRRITEAEPQRLPIRVSANLGAAASGGLGGQQDAGATPLPAGRFAGADARAPAKAPCPAPRPSATPHGPRRSLGAWTLCTTPQPTDSPSGAARLSISGVARVRCRRWPPACRGASWRRPSTGPLGGGRYQH